MTRPLDDLDKSILAELEKNARETIIELARKLKVPNSTVRDRINKLEESGVIKGYTTVLDHKKMGYGIKAIIQVTRDTAIPMDKTLLDVLHVPEITSIQFVTGDVDELVTVYIQDIDHLKEIIFSRLTSLNWNSKLNTMIIMDEMSFPFAQRVLVGLPQGGGPEQTE
jgi:DNA-binding Lrp family transcriptional regulator